MLLLYVYSSWIFYLFLVSTRCWFHFLWWCVVRRKIHWKHRQVSLKKWKWYPPFAAHLNLGCIYGLHIRHLVTPRPGDGAGYCQCRSLRGCRRTMTSRRVSGCTFSHRTMSPATFAAFVQQHCDTDFLRITIFFNPQNPKSSKLCVCTTFSSICGSLPSLSLPLFLHFDILCFSDTLPISLSLCVLSRHQHVFLIILCVQEAN